MSDGLTCPRCRRISSLPSRAERIGGRGYVCRFCGAALLPMPPPHPREHIATARAARVHAERLMLRMPDVTPLELARVASRPAEAPPAPRAATAEVVTARSPVAADAARIAAWTHARALAMWSLIFGTRARRSSFHRP
ncbi:MAG TPA: hypothetical protein VFA01_08445 [Candidatus Dormibacteraeota bacterium]|nr:hypothetical protein [Candidatus Dormibacteraeota bacterium]